MFSWADIAVAATQAVSVVVDIDVLEHGAAGVFARGEAFAADCLDLEAVEEALRAGVVVTVGFRAYGGAQVVTLDDGLVGVGAVLHAAIGVDDDARRIATAIQCHRQGLAGHFGVDGPQL